jgi:hypothetical protein
VPWSLVSHGKIEVGNCLIHFFLEGRANVREFDTVGVLDGSIIMINRATRPHHDLGTMWLSKEHVGVQLECSQGFFKGDIIFARQ